MNARPQSLTSYSGMGIGLLFRRRQLTDGQYPQGSCKGVRDMESSTNGKRLVRRSITVNRPIAEVYRFWRELENLPRYSQNLLSVSVDGLKSHWVAQSPGGTVEWDSEITDDVQNELLAWRSLPGSEIQNQGTVKFQA